MSPPGTGTDERLTDKELAEYLTGYLRWQERRERREIAIAEDMIEMGARATRWVLTTRHPRVRGIARDLLASMEALDKEDRAARVGPWVTALADLRAVASTENVLKLLDGVPHPPDEAMEEDGERASNLTNLAKIADRAYLREIIARIDPDIVLAANAAFAAAAGE